MTSPRAPLRAPSASLDRRAFIEAAGFAMLAVQCLPAAAFASRVPVDATRAADDLLIESGPGAFHHVHYLRIPKTRSPRG